MVPLLLEQITAPVRWEESMRTLAAPESPTPIELGAGRVLAGLMRRISREVERRRSGRSGLAGGGGKGAWAAAKR